MPRCRLSPNVCATMLAFCAFKTCLQYEDTCFVHRFFFLNKLFSQFQSVLPHFSAVKILSVEIPADPFVFAQQLQPAHVSIPVRVMAVRWQIYYLFVALAITRSHVGFENLRPGDAAGLAQGSVACGLRATIPEVISGWIFLGDFWMFLMFWNLFGSGFCRGESRMIQVLCLLRFPFCFWL